MNLTLVRSMRAPLILSLLAIVTLGACNAAAVAGEARTLTEALASAGDQGGGGTSPGGTAGGGTSPGGADEEPPACEACDPIDPTDPSDPGDPSDPTKPDDPVTGVPGPVEPLPGDGATHVEPQPGITNAIPHAIDHITVANDGRHVTVYWWGGVEDCYGLKDVLVDHDADGTLVLTVLEGTRPDLGDVACIEIALLKATTITLDQPLFVSGSES